MYASERRYWYYGTVSDRTRHRWTILVARWVSFSAVTRMLCAFLIESGRRCNNSVKRAGSSNRWNCSPRGIRERGSANPLYGPGPRYCPALYRVCTIPVKSEVSWILHVESLPLLLRLPTYVDGAWSVYTVVPASRAWVSMRLRKCSRQSNRASASL